MKYLQLLSHLAEVGDICKYFDISCETDNNSTGGWVMEQLSKIPETGETFEYENLQIEITETDTHRVIKIKVKVFEKESKE